MISREEIVPIGKFQKTHALKGELNMISDIEPDYYLEGHPLIVNTDGIYVPFYVESVRPKGSTSYLVKIEGVNSESEASEFVNKEIFMLRDDAEEWLEEEPDDPNYWNGFIIEDIETGIKIGEVIGVDDSTANVLFIVKNERGEEIYVPANDDFVEEINEESKIIKMNLPEGLVDLNSKK